jgi:hypothetical protein
MKKPRKAETSVWEEPDAYDKDKYYTHLLDQYKIYIEMTDRLSARRILVNNSFITMIGAGAIAYAAAPVHFGDFGPFFRLGITAVCILLAVLWRATIAYYRDLSSAKFKVIHEIEELLPAQLFKMEWEYLQAARRAANKKDSRGQATMEMRLPVFAGFISLLGLLATLPPVYQEILKILKL